MKTKISKTAQMVRRARKSHAFHLIHGVTHAAYFALCYLDMHAAHAYVSGALFIAAIFSIGGEHE
jgi:hypothetical protein